METQTPLAKDIEITNQISHLDASCKKILGHKNILAWILKECVEEFHDSTIKDIAEKYIEGEPEISSETVHQDEVIPEKIKGLNTEDKTITESTVTYDIKFTAIIPGTDMKVHMYINVEAQNDFYPGYPLIKRVIYYCCRMISAQYSREFTQSEYDKLKKVCSIWICTNPPEVKKNTITEYAIQERTIIGNSTEKKENYDLIRGIMICLGDYDNSEGILKLLNTLTANDFNDVKKKRILEDEFNLEMTRDLNLEVTDMCNIGEGVYKRGMQEGEQKGEQKGILKGRQEGRQEAMSEMIDMLRLYGMSEEEINKVLAQQEKLQNLPVQESKEYIYS